MTKVSQGPTIAIVGAGLGGLALALFMHQAGIHPTIFEGRSRTAADGGYLALAPNALAVLDDLGLYHDLLPKGFAYEELTFLSARNCSRIGAVLNGSQAKYGYPALRISRHVVRQTLLQAAEEAKLQIRFDSKVTSVEDANDCVSLSFQGGVRRSFTYVVGADGIHSRVRRIISSLEPTWSGQMGIGGGLVPRREVDENLPLPCIFTGRSNAFMMMPTVADGSIVNFFATIETGARSREEWTKLGEDKAQLAGILKERHCHKDAEWPEVVKKVCKTGDANSLTVWPHFHAPVLDSWISRTSRVILLGDAAHAMPPSGGSGAAMAFEDAASLAQVFAGNKRPEAEIDLTSALQQWQNQRQERVRKVRAFTATSSATRKATSSWLQQIVKEYLMWIYFLVKGKDGGFAWIYSHKEQGPRRLSTIPEEKE